MFMTEREIVATLMDQCLTEDGLLFTFYAFTAQPPLREGVPTTAPWELAIDREASNEQKTVGHIRIHTSSAESLTEPAAHESAIHQLLVRSGVELEDTAITYQEANR